MSCIRGNYNASVKAIDKTTVMYQDMSDWMDTPDKYMIDIYKPNEEKVSVEVRADRPVKIDQLGVVNDGIYTIETNSCGIRYKRRVGLFFNIECCIKKSYSLVEARLHPMIEEVREYVKMAKCAIEMNDFTLANDLFDIAQDKMERINCDCGC